MAKTLAPRPHALNAALAQLLDQVETDTNYGLFGRNKQQSTDLRETLLGLIHRTIREHLTSMDASSFDDPDILMGLVSDAFREELEAGARLEIGGERILVVPST